MQLHKIDKIIFNVLVAVGACQMACLTTACNGQKQSDASVEDTMADTIVTTQTDSDTIPDLPAEEPKEEIVDAKTLRNPYSNADQAMEYMRNSGQWDKYSSGILPAMASENLEYCGRLLSNPYKYFIVVDKATMKVILFDRYGNVVKEYGMACAKNFGTKHKKADSRTPEGFFSAGSVYDSREWLFTDDNGVTHPQKGVYGPRFIRVSNPVTTQIGIHGTGSPGSIGKRVSHGCIRLNNESIVDLVKYVQTGMPIIVNPGPHDRAVNSSEGVRVLSITTGVAPYKNAQTVPVVKEVKTEKTDSANMVTPDTIALPAAETKPQVNPEPTQEPVNEPAQTGQQEQ